MLRADVVVSESTRLINGELDHLLGARGEADLAEHWSLTTPDDELHRLAHLDELNVEVLKDLGGDTFTLTNESEEEVLRADVVVVEALCLVLSERQHLPGTVRKAIEAVSSGHALLRSPRRRCGRNGTPRSISLPLPPFAT